MYFLPFSFDPCFFSSLLTECAHQTFIFDGRCYNTCPERSFIVQEKVSENIQSKGLSLKKRRHAMNIDEFDSLEDIIERSQYTVKNRAISSPESSITPQKLCGSCHEICLKCNGPTENDCLTCDSDYNQIIIGSRIICHGKMNVVGNSDVASASSPITTTVPSTEMLNDENKSVLNSVTNQLKNYSIEKIVLVSSMIGILLMIISICIYLLFIKCDCDILSSFYGKTKQFLLSRASSSNSSGIEREKYSYNIVEMEERSPLTTDLPESKTRNYDDDDDDEDSDVSDS